MPRAAIDRILVWIPAHVFRPVARISRGCMARAVCVTARRADAGPGRALATVAAALIANEVTNSGAMTNLRT